MAVNCGVSFGVCAVRITRVDSSGAVIAGNNSYVTDKPISVQIGIDKETGNTFSVRNGCGCGIAKVRTPDVLNWYTITFTQAAMEPVMQDFMLGADPILDGLDTVGVNYPSQLACDDDEPAVAFEFWTQHIVGNAQDATFPWIHWVAPMVIFSLNDMTAEEGILQPVVEGFTRENGLWGDGPYADGPPDGTDIHQFGWWKTDVDPPTAECNAQPVTATS